MIVKVATRWIGKAGDLKFGIRGKKIVKKMTNNPHFTSPPASPALPLVDAAVDDFLDALTDTPDGGTLMTAIKERKRLVAEDLLRQLAIYVQVQCHGSMEVLLSSGFPAQKPVRETIGKLATPGNPTLTHAGHGALKGGCNPVFGAIIYNWRLTSTSPGAVGRTGQDSPSYFIFTGLVPGATYTLEVCVGGTAGPSDWSSPVTLICD